MKTGPVRTLSVVPVSTHQHDQRLITALAEKFSIHWSAETSGTHLPVIPETGFYPSPVHATSEAFQRTGTWTDE
ncbi:MAG: hypothetical protein R6V12_04340, partial [Candidatus Hydrogenedentota bacterium]